MFLLDVGSSYQRIIWKKLIFCVLELESCLPEGAVTVSFALPFSVCQAFAVLNWVLGDLKTDWWLWETNST